MSPPTLLSRFRKPQEISVEEWQRTLRRQFGPEQPFLLENVGEHAFFSEFRITNPRSERTYRVAIRGEETGVNFCSCPDFATNTLGTCKHVEFTLAALRRKRGGRKALLRGWDPPGSSVTLLYGAKREVRFRAGRQCPPRLKELAHRLFDRGSVLKPEAFGRLCSFREAAARSRHVVRFYDDALSFVETVIQEEQRRRVLLDAFPDGIRSEAFTELLRAPLYDYQREGALFAARAGRSLLADEMGLGKTVQALAAAEILARHLRVERVLVVCPTSLKHQWRAEITRFSGRPVLEIEGGRKRREEGFLAPGFYKITSYDTVHRDLDLIGVFSPGLVILDEAQRIKNWSTRAARAVKRISSPYAMVLTGTPLENRLEELVSIVQFVDQHHLGPTFRLLHNHRTVSDTGQVVGYRDLDKLGESLAPILLRRRKDEVLRDLPGRMEKRYVVPMTPEQRLFHEENREIVARLVQKWKRHGFLSDTDQKRLRIALQMMRMSCDSTYLLDHRTDHGTKADELVTVLEELFETPGTKVVVFSQWVRMHELIQRRIRGRGWDSVFFHGGVESRKRGGLVERFRKDPACRLFLSTDAGGVGLNLQNASVVVQMDLPWNPAVIEQRIGRVHRLGQTRPVEVISFVSQGTIEERMLSVLRFKSSLFSGVLDKGDKDVLLSGSRLGKFLEAVESVTSPPSEPVLENPGGVPSRERSAGRPGDGRAPSPPSEKETARQAVAPSRGASADPLTILLQMGVSFLEQLAAAAPRVSLPVSRAVPSLFERARDEATGKTYLKVPLPDPEVVILALSAVQKLLDKLPADPG